MGGGTFGAFPEPISGPKRKAAPVRGGFPAIATSDLLHFSGHFENLQQGDGLIESAN